MSEQDLDQQIRDYYMSQSMDASKMDAILASTKFVQRPFWRQPAALTVLAAMLVAVMTLSVYLLPSPPTSTQVAAEISKSFFKTDTPVVVTNDYMVAQKNLPQINFSITSNRPSFRARFELLGGCYCTLMNQLTARLRVRERDSGDICTLYVTKIGERMENIQEGEHITNGVKVRFWKEGDRLFALAGHAVTQNLPIP